MAAMVHSRSCLAFASPNSLVSNAIPTSRERGAVAAPGKYLPLRHTQEQMTGTVAHTPGQRKEKNNEVG
jgi:hypothetical protein